MAAEVAATPPAPPIPTHAWRLFTPDEWAAVEASGSFFGTPLDERDGYIHLSLGSEVRTTVTRYFANASLLILAKVSLEQFAARGAVRMDYVAARAAFFPHVFDAVRGNDDGPPPAIPRECFLSTHRLELSQGSGFSGWPEGL